MLGTFVVQVGSQIARVGTYKMCHWSGCAIAEVAHIGDEFFKDNLVLLIIF